MGYSLNTDRFAAESAVEYIKQRKKHKIIGGKYGTIK